MWLKDPYDNYASREPENGESRQIPIYKPAPIPNLSTPCDWCRLLPCGCNEGLQACKACNAPTRSQPCQGCDVRSEDIDPNELEPMPELDMIDPHNLQSHTNARGELREMLLAWWATQEAIEDLLEEQPPFADDYHSRLQHLHARKAALVSELSPEAMGILETHRRFHLPGIHFRYEPTMGALGLGAWRCEDL